MPKWHWRGERSGGKTPLWVNPFHSLPTRISLIMFGATLVTSLIVTAISVNSIDSFLRGKIEQKFPAILAAAGQKLDLWYDQRTLEVGVFATSATLAENLSLLDPASPAGQRERAYSEVRQYLSYVLDGFPQYCSLFLLVGDGDVLLWVVVEMDLPDALRL